MDKTSSQRIAPALGISWANLVTVRLMLSRTQRAVNVPKSSITDKTVETYQSPIRAMEVTFAPHLPNTVCYYTIDEAGVKGLS